MDLKKTGNFIATLRKDKKLTQAELGDMVGVTDKAVSKWERGQSFPDSSILTEVSEVLGVTTTELLNGDYIESNSPEKINNITESGIKFYEETEKKKYGKKIILLIIGILILSLVIVAIFISNRHNQCEIYSVSSEDKQFSLSGVFIVTNKKNTLMINNIKYNGESIPDIYITKYEIIQKNNVYYRKYNNDVNNSDHNNNSLNKSLQDFNIYLKDNTKELSNMLKETTKIKIDYICKSDNICHIYIQLKFTKQFSNSSLFYQ